MQQINTNIYQIGGGLIHSDNARAGRNDWPEIASAMASTFGCSADQIGRIWIENDERRIEHITVDGKPVAYFW